MINYFSRVVGLLKRHDYIFLGQGSGKYEVWQKFSRNVIVPNRCVSRHTANSVLKSARIKFSFSENSDMSDVEYMNHMRAMEEKDLFNLLTY